jgi:hypothetical protein
VGRHVIGVVPAIFLFLGLASLSQAASRRRDEGPLRALSAQAVDQSRRLDAGEFNLYLSNTGSFGFDVSNGRAGLIYPRNSSKTILFAGGLWIGALVAGSPRVTVAEYSQEYDPGQILSGAPEDPSDPALMVYKVSRFLGDISDTARIERSPAELAMDPRLDPILHHSWSEYLLGASKRGAPVRLHRLPLTTTPEQEDSVDVLGPDVKGDQMTWCVFNDARPQSHTNEAGETAPLDVEVRRTIHTYRTPGILGSTAFVEYRIFNRGSQVLTDLMASHWADPDIGAISDDLIGTDQALGMVYAYNGEANDPGFSSNPGYGTRPPALGIMVLGGQLNDGPSNLPVYSTNFYVNGTDPQSAVQSYNYMLGLTSSGGAVVDPVTSQTTRFVYPGDPVAGTGWLDGTASDKRMMISTAPVTLAPGDSLTLQFAIVAAQGFDRLTSVSLLKRYADFVRDHHLGADRGPKADLAIVTQEIPSVIHGCEPFSLSMRSINFGPSVGPVPVRWRLTAAGSIRQLADSVVTELPSGAAVDVGGPMELGDEELASELVLFAQVDRFAALPDIDRTNNSSSIPSTHAVPALRSFAQVSSSPNAQARVRFGRSWRDSTVTLTPIHQYEIYRRAEGPSGLEALRTLDTEAVLQDARKAGMISDGALLTAGWDYVGAVPAHGTSQYSIVVPLLPEIPSPSGHQAFLVRAATQTPTLYFDSCVDSMPQVDSLPPPTPANLRATGVSPSGDVQLAWDPVPAPDLRFYRVYRGSGTVFPPDQDHFVGTATTSGFVDPAAAAGGVVRFYQVVAEDFLGNTGEPAITSSGTVDVTSPPLEFAVAPPAPNPSSAGQTIRFTLPSAGRVTLAIHDVAGRLVREPYRESPFASGAHEWSWDGRDSRGRRVPPGVYMIRLVDGIHSVIVRALRME